MSLLDTASLIVTPNGYKASKLYSIVPSDGTGDLTWTRTGDTATRQNSSGVIETVTANKPRLDYLDSTCPKLLLEPQRTNLVLYSEQFDNAYWTKLGVTITANSTTGPDGTTTADTMNCVATAYNLLRRSPATTIGSIYTASMFVKKNNYRYIALRFGVAGSGDYYNFYDFDTNTVNNTAVSANPIKAENYGNGWYRLSMTFTATATSHVFDVGYCTSTGATAPAPAGTEKYYIWGAQVELGSFVTSYIATTTATVTRNADSSSKTAISSLIGSTEGTIFCQLQALGNTSDFRRIAISDGTFNNKISIGYSSSNTFQAVLTLAGTLIVNFDQALTITNNIKIAFKYKANSFTLFINGVSVLTQSSGSTFSASTLTSIYFSEGNGVLFPFNGKVSSLALWKTALADADCVTLTTL